MVFENLTLFEIRLEDAQFGPRSLRSGQTDDEMESDESSGRGRLLAMVALTLLTAGLVVLWRRVRSNVDEELGAAYDDGEVAVEESDIATTQ